MKRVFLAIAALATLASCVSGGKPKEEVAEVESAPAAVITRGVEAEAGEIDLTEKFTSEIMAYRENNITPAASGVRVDRIYFDVGDMVAEGEVVATLDPTLYNQQMISVANLKSDYERLKPVYEAGGISRQTLDQAKTALDVQSEIADNIKKNIELKSPISGVVTERSAEEGDLFANQPIMHIADISRVKVMVDISEQYFPVVKVGMPVDLTLEIYPDEVFEGRVSLIYPAMNPQSRTFTVEVTVPNGAMKLRPGMYGTTTFSMGRKSGVLVPDIAIQKQYGSAEYFVYIAEDGHAVRRRVERGRQLGTMVEVEGVEVGDMVLTTAFSRLMDGAAVELKN